MIIPWRCSLPSPGAQILAWISRWIVRTSSAGVPALLHSMQTESVWLLRGRLRLAGITGIVRPLAPSAAEIVRIAEIMQLAAILVRKTPASEAENLFSSRCV